MERASTSIERPPRSLQQRNKRKRRDAEHDYVSRKVKRPPRHYCAQSEIVIET
jgi:hypothetical protein